ncbi:MAG: SRPBCC family protein [Cyanobacteria bacterium P01_D01_bin.115]
MPKIVEVEKSTIINVPVERLWKVSADEFEHIDRWDGNVKTSHPSSDAIVNAPVEGRVCNLYGGGRTVERFVELDDSKYTFVYEITEGLPGFVISARNTWIHEAIAGNKTQLTMRVVMRVKGLLGRIMQCPMKLQMGKVLSNAQEELKHYIETGQPHPRKRKKMKRAKK